MFFFLPLLTHCLDRLQRIMKKALRKSSATSDEESLGNVGAAHHHHHHHRSNSHNPDDENTDTEQHESLPHDQEDEDNKINTQKQSTSGGEKKRDLFPELIKKLRESAKKTSGNVKATAEAVIDVQPLRKTATAPSVMPTVESTDDDEQRVVRERRKSLLRRGMKGTEPEGEAAKFDVIDETSGGAKPPTATGTTTTSSSSGEKQPKKNGRAKASVFTFDVSPTRTEPNQSSSENEAKGEASPKSPIYATVNKVKKSPVDGGTSDDSIKGKFNSFFTIVREAVRRQSVVAEQLDSELPSPSSSIRTTPKPEHPVPPPIYKRDSDCSLWSDNIPVITISKTGSDECILEEKRVASSSSAPSSDGEHTKEEKVKKEPEDIIKDIKE